MEKLQKSLLLFKERNCSVSLVLDTRTNRKDVTTYPLSLRFTIDRRFFYHHVSGSFTEAGFSEICRATKSASSNYRRQKAWRDEYGEKYNAMLCCLNKGGRLTFEMVRQAVTTGNAHVRTEDSRASFFGIWEKIIHELKTENNGDRYTTSESYEFALKSFRKIMGEDAVKGFNISVAEIRKWKDGMANGVSGPNGVLVGKVANSTIGIYLRACRAVWNRCMQEGYLRDVAYPFSNKREKGLVSIPVSAKRRQQYLNVGQMTELYNLFVSRKYPDAWSEDYTRRAHYSLGLFLAQYLCNGFNLADAARLTYNDYYWQNGGRAFLFNRKKTARNSQDNSEVIIPITEPLQRILDEIAAAPTRGGYVFPGIFNGEEREAERRKRTQQENSNITDRVRKICLEVLHWDESINPSNTWCRHSFATNLRNAGVEKDYISESMGHSGSEHAITQIYLDYYPLETQMKYNSLLLCLDKDEGEKEKLLSMLSDMSVEELSNLLASRAQ